MNLAFAWVAWCVGLFAPGLVACEMGGAGRGEGDDGAGTGVTELAPVAANHNQVVGSYRGTGQLPDGRAIEIQLAARPTAELDVVIAVEGREVGQDSGFAYDLRDGTWWLGRAVAVPIDGGRVLLRQVPTVDGWTQAELVLSSGAGSTEPFDVRFVRTSPAPLGGDNMLRVAEASADCNVLAQPNKMGALVTDLWVPIQPVDGKFTAFASLDADHGERAFSLLIYDIDFFGDKNPRVGQAIALPKEGVQLNYNEQQDDGTIRQWTATGGRIVWDAVDVSLVPASGEPTEAGLFTFHFEGLAMEPSNSLSDPRFVGASGTFVLEFSGTSTRGSKRQVEPTHP